CKAEICSLKKSQPSLMKHPSCTTLAADYSKGR
ncbi:PAS fold family protein, partial [Vibrio parahaemolyticus V-223/04]